MPHGSLAAFKQTLARKKARDVKKKSLYNNKHEVSKSTEKKTVINIPKLSASELEIVKRSIKKKLIKERLKTRVSVSIILMLFLVIIFTFILNF